jgi:2-oxo-3-hexenedioate decarboxylase
VTSETASPTGLADGLRALLAARDEELARGASAVGWKVGFNGPAVQALFGLDGLVVGYINDTTVLEPGRAVDLAGWTQPALEVEVALRVGADGDLAAVAPALELVDLDLPLERLEPILAANIFHRGVIFGPETTPDACDGLVVSVAARGTGAVVATGSLTDGPAWTLDTVRAFLAAHGAQLEPGHRIIAGSLIAPLAVAPGDDLTVDFGALGSLAVSFAG